MSNIAISLVGAPGSGKTFLAKKLAKHYDAKLIEELSEEMPNWVKENLNQQKNLFENQIWFRNLHVKNHKTAMNLRKNCNVILDCPFYQSKIYNDYFMSNSHLNLVLSDITQLDFETFEHTDITIYIKNDEESLRKFLDLRKEYSEWEDENLKEFFLGVLPYVNKFMNSIESKIPNIITIDRKNYDFNDEEDFLKLINMINEVLDRKIMY